MRFLAMLLILVTTSCRSPAPEDPTSETTTAVTEENGEPTEEKPAEIPVEDSSDVELGVESNGVSVNVGVNVDGASANKPDDEDVELELTFNRKVNWGYGCGGHCATNTDGSSSVTFVCMKDGTAMMADAGEENMQVNYPDGTSSEKTAWSQTWSGTCERQMSALVFELKRTTNVCVKTSVAGGQSSESSCAKSSKKMLVGCKLEEVEVVEEIWASGSTEGAEKLKAWNCEPHGENVNPGGTPIPWVFGDTDCIDTLYAGEPHAKTFHKKCE